jgi:isocitrate dehydrogenase kinase/phosphatase
MKETRTINLNGLVYHIDYDAYQLLRDYLHDIELRLPQEDRQEVIADIEARIAELLQKALFAKNMQVVNIEIVNSVKMQIGQPSEFGPNARP